MIQKDLMQWNAILSFCIGFILNSLLIWLCVQERRKELHDVRRILLQICIVDLALLSITAILQPIFIIYRGISVCYLYSQWKWMDSIEPFGQSIMVATWLAIYFFSCYGFSVQFLYRYFVVNKSMKIKFWHYLMMLGIPATISLIFGLWIFIDIIAEQTTLNSTERVHLSQLLIGQIQDDIKFAYSIKFNFDAIAFTFCELLANIGAFSLIAICSYKMFKFIGNNSATEQERVRNRQITWSLLIMAFFPFLICINNLGTVLSSILIQIQSDMFLFNFAAAYFSIWLPVFNPLVSLLTIRPFRRKICVILFNCKMKKNDVTPIVVRPLAISSNNEVIVVKAATQIN